MPFLVEPPIEHRCSLPGKEVAVGALWYCAKCYLIWEFSLLPDMQEAEWWATSDHYARRLVEAKPEEFGPTLKEELDAISDYS